MLKPSFSFLQNVCPQGRQATAGFLILQVTCQLWLASAFLSTTGLSTQKPRLSSPCVCVCVHTGLIRKHVSSSENPSLLCFEFSFIESIHLNGFILYVGHLYRNL